jgi:hypothetical protein
MTISLPTPGSANWNVPLNAALTQLDTDKVDATQETADIAAGVATAEADAASKYLHISGGGTVTGDVTVNGHVSATGASGDASGQVVFTKSLSPNTHALTAYQANTTGTTNAAANVVSDNPNFSALEVTGTEKNRGSIKVAHAGYSDGSDSSAAAISIDLQTTHGGATGTAAQGLFITSTTDTGATAIGDPIRVVLNGRDDFAVHSNGTVGIRVASAHAPAGALEISQGDTSTVGLAMTATAGSTQDMIALKDSGGSLRFEVGSSGSAVHRATSFFTSALQLGATSADLGGSSGAVISMKNVTTPPNSNPSGGGILYVDAGALKYRGSSGTVTTIAPA